MPKGIKGFQKGYIPWNKGKKCPFISKILKGKSSNALNKHWKLSEKTKRKMSERMKGEMNPAKRPEARKKLSEAKKGQIPKYLFTPELNKRRSKALKGMKCHLWKGGISFEPYSTDWTETLKRSIRERDNYICQLCSQYGNVVHHIDYCKKNCNPNNLITLCCGCNSRVNSNRDYWINYFSSIS